MNKILVLSYHYPPCAYGCSIRVVNFVKFLPENNFKPVILSVKPVYYKDHSADDHSHRSGMPADIQIVRTDSIDPAAKIASELNTDQKNTPASQGFIARLKNRLFKMIQQAGYALLIPDVQILWAPHAIGAGKKLLADSDTKIIFAVAPPFSVFLAGYFLKKITGKKLALDFKDMWVGRNQHEHNNILCSLFSRAIEKMLIKAADSVILTTDYAYMCFEKRYPDHVNKFVVIPNGFDPQLQDVIRQESAGSPNCEKLFKIAHTGTLDTDRSPEVFIQAVKELKEDFPDFADNVKIYFSGKVHHIYQDLVKELGLDNIFVFKGYLNYHDNIALLNQASLLLLLTTHDAPDAVPGKLYEYFALEKPILAISEDGASTQLLRKYGWDKIVHPKDKDGIKEHLYTLYQEFCQGKLKAPDIPVDKYNRRNQTKQLAEVFGQLVD